MKKIDGNDQIERVTQMIINSGNLHAEIQYNAIKKII